MKWILGVLLTLGALGVVGSIVDPPDAAQPTEVAATAPVAPSSSSAPEPEPKPALLFVRDLKDGDSFVASNGTEYRLGLVDTAELSEPCGREARLFTGDFLADGFTVVAYSSDSHGRSVAEVAAADGASLNVALAASGLGNDKYLEQFRYENRELAARLDIAFAKAPTPDCLAAAPAPAPKPKPKPQPLVQQPAKSNCNANYEPCLPDVADLDCGEIGRPVTVTGSDVYRLDRDGDGTGCD